MSDVSGNKPKLPNRIVSKTISDNYKNWKENSLQEGGFFVVFNTFKDDYYLRDLSGGAVKLFLFFGISGKNKTGESYYTIEQIAKYFKKSTRTIENWVHELEDKKLIKRLQKGLNSVTYTYLLPY